MPTDAAGEAGIESGARQSNATRTWRQCGPKGSGAGARIRGSSHAPFKHHSCPPACVVRAIEYHPEATVDRFAPASATTVVQLHPGGTADGVADNILPYIARIDGPAGETVPVFEWTCGFSRRVPETEKVHVMSRRIPK